MTMYCRAVGRGDDVLAPAWSVLVDWAVREHVPHESLSAQRDGHHEASLIRAYLRGRVRLVGFL